MNEPGLSAAIKSMARSRSLACPTSWTIRSLANRLAVSTMIVALDPLKHIGEAGPGVDRIGTAHGGVVKLSHDLVARSTGERGDGLSLATVAVLIGADIRRRAGPQ